MILADKLSIFYSDLRIGASLPPGVEVMNPYQDTVIREICSEFFNKFYPDDSPRRLILGINPGRFGAGVTGITFTDPVRLEMICGIQNPFNKKQELSSVFIYDMIEAFGGPGSFFSHYLLSAVSPLGFKKDGKNLNYYDDRNLQEALTPFIIDALNQHIGMGFLRDRIFCLGEGKNYNFLTELNKEHRFFREIIPLSHPRWIMQYRYNSRNEFVSKYLDVLLKK